MSSAAVATAFRIVAVVAARVLGWSRGTTLLALAAAVPPLVTVWFERWASRTGRLVLRPAEAAAAPAR